jgi:hypothetical protein
VSIYAAERLIEVIGGLRCGDRDIQLRLHGLRRQLVESVRDAAPWRARNHLDVIVMLDAPSWARCSRCSTSARCSTGDSRSPGPAPDDRPFDYQFISQNSDLGMVREFMTSLGARLAP